MTLTETYWPYEITNGCACQDFDETLADWVPAEVCTTWCFDDACEEFAVAVADLIDAATRFEITGFPTWRGPIGGLFDATTAREMLNAITPDRTEWILRYRVEGDTLTGVLAHHDGTGSITVRPMPDDEEE